MGFGLLVWGFRARRVWGSGQSFQGLGHRVSSPSPQARSPARVAHAHGPKTLMHAAEAPTVGA